MRFLIFLICYLAIGVQFCVAQNTPNFFGYQHLELQFEDNPVDVLVYSKEGDENTKKPLFLFCQGSLPIPLITFNDNTVYHPTPFSRKLITKEYHLVIIGKPGIPVIAHLDSLNLNREFLAKNSELPPKTYTTKNYLDFFVERNNTVLNHLLKQSWVDPEKVVVAGHSEGSSIAAKLGATNPDITHIIYSGGTPYFSRILSQISQDRSRETLANSIVEANFKYWKRTLSQPYDISRDHGWNMYKGTYQFSENASESLKRINVPTLVSYGTKDSTSPFNDLLRLECIYEVRKNIEFKPYLNLEHNYFPIKEDGTIDYNKFGWDHVVSDWLAWIKNKK